MAVAWVQRTATDTMGELTTYFHPTNLTNSLTKQDGKDVLWNSVLCAGAFAPGFAAASVTGGLLNSINYLENIPLINYVASLVIKTVSFGTGVYANFWVVKNILPVPVAFSADKAIRLYCLTAGGYFVAHYITTFIQAQWIFNLSHPLPVASIAGHFPASSLYVMGGIGAAMGALSPVNLSRQQSDDMQGFSKKGT